ncbi:MAG: RsmB/NOP family class I SAM-dependent RNA methyltransferase [Candidatus Aenigmarchaeota archaeon]|nr:RsmB/NOP family class I SAM-dependent RNA methyltransferase [Candidatus Aenigmarchaeota archaeon]
MQIHEKLKERLMKLGLDETIYEMRTRKCILSREKLNLEKVPWFDGAYFIDASFTNRNDCFIFDPISIIPCLALEPKKEDKILDVCAAPGTKTFILSFMTDNETKITANDIDKFRVRRLKANVNKFNISAEVMNASGRKITGSFSKILLDAPCSGEGMINKKDKIFQHWSEKRVRLLAKAQKKLIQHAFEILEKGGILVYSTCTFEPEENEEAVDFLLDKFDDACVDKVDVNNIVYDGGITEWNGKKFNNQVKNCMRIHPQHNRTGGFFVAKMRKL